jgi:hypothetical protein
MIDHLALRVFGCFLAACVLGLAALVASAPGISARRVALFWGLIGAALLACATARADGYTVTGVGSGSGPVGVLSDGSVMVPVIWDNETGAPVEVDCAKPGGSGIYYTLWPVQGVSALSWVLVPLGGCYFQAFCPSDTHEGDTFSPAMDLSGTNVNIVTFVCDSGSVAAGGMGGVSVVNYGYIRPDQAQEFLWPWFIAGFTLACTGIAYQLIWRQVRNIGGEAPTM